MTPCVMGHVGGWNIEIRKQLAILSRITTKLKVKEVKENDTEKEKEENCTFISTLSINFPRSKNSLFTMVNLSLVGIVNISQFTIVNP